MVKVSDAFDLSMGKTPARDNQSYWGGSNKWITISDLSSGGKYITSTKENISDKAIVETSISMVPKGTIIMSFKLSIGKTAITGEDMYTNEAIMAFRDKGKYAICQDYIYHLFNNWDWGDNSNKAVKGLTLNKKTLSLAEFPLPDFEVQERIAWHLNKVDELTTYRKKQLDELNLLIKSRFVEMFGDPVTNPYNYPVHKLSEYIKYLTSGSRGWAKYCVDDGKEWFITIKNVKGTHISIENMQPINVPDNAEAKRTKVKEGDLLISVTADLGRTGVVTKEIADHGAFINQHLVCIRLNNEVLNPFYAAYYMESEAGKRQFDAKNQTGVKAGLNFDSINSLRILLPPLKEQIRFVNFSNQVDKSRLAVQKSLDELEILKKSLMQQYFG